MTQEQYNILFAKAKALMQKTKDQNHDWPHIESVLKNADKILDLLLMEKEINFDKNLLSISIIYHDLSYVYYRASFCQYFLEGERTAKILRPIFRSVGVSPEETELVVDIIKHHIGSYFGFNVKNKGKTIYHKIMHDADQMDGNGFNPERVKKAEAAAKHSFYWFFVIRFLKPIFFNYFCRTLKIYNMPEIVGRIKEEKKCNP